MALKPVASWATTGDGPGQGVGKGRRGLEEKAGAGPAELGRPRLRAWTVGETMEGWFGFL